MPQFYKSDTLWVSPGYRVDAMVKMPSEKQTLCLVARGVTDPLGTVIATLDVDPEAGSPTEVNLLMNFRKFTGQFVLHCHKLNHEDDGMMEYVELCAKGDQECLCQGVDANNTCISQAGCKADDLRCQYARTATDAFPLPPPPNPALCGPPLP